MTLLTATLSHHYTRASIETIKRHASSQRGLCQTSALRLLRRNVRDAAPGTNRALQWSTARQVLELIQRGEV
jgi:hypothetical protein